MPFVSKYVFVAYRDASKLWKFPTVDQSGFQTWKWRMISVTRLGDFWIFWGIHFITKVSQMIGNFLGNFKNHRLLNQTVVAPFRATFGQTRASFYSNIWSHCAWSHLKFVHLIVGFLSAADACLLYEVQKAFFCHKRQ